MLRCDCQGEEYVRGNNLEFVRGQSSQFVDGQLNKANDI